ncbi:MAG: glycosyltransferase family 4 protein [Pseudomonadota bacterium]
MKWIDRKSPVLKADRRALVRDPDAPLRILMTSYRSHPFSGGQGVYMRHLTRALSDLGHSVDVISGPPYPDLDPRVRLIMLPSLDLYAEKYPLRALRPKHLKSFTDLYEWAAHNSGKFPEPYTFGRRLEKYMADKIKDYDVVHDNQTLSWGILKLRDMGAPLVATLHHPITVDRDLALAANAGWGFKKWGMRQLIRRWHSFLPMQIKVAQEIDHIVTISDVSRRDFSREFSLDTDKIRKVSLGIDTDAFRPMPEVETQPESLICTSSADVALKGLVYLIDALGLLADTRPNLTLTVVGSLRDGPTKRRLKKLGLTDRVRFVSGISQEELTRAYNEAAIAVAPSLYEGFGFPAAEAMSCETPVIATTGGALPEAAGDAGVLVPPKDPKALAAAIEDLLDHPDKRAAMAKAGRAHVLNAFSWARCAMETADIYRQAINDAHTAS